MCEVAVSGVTQEHGRTLPSNVDGIYMCESARACVPATSSYLLPVFTVSASCIDLLHLRPPSYSSSSSSS